MAEEQKSAYSSPRININQTRIKASPSFIERRRQRLLSSKEQQSTAASSSGTKSQQTVQQCLKMNSATFSVDMFRRSPLTISSIPKSVEEEPNSGNSTKQLRHKTEEGVLQPNKMQEFVEQLANKKTSTLTLNTLKGPALGIAILRGDANISDQG